MYRFPYHHIVDFDLKDYGRFTQTRNNPGGYRYASYLIRTIEELEGLTFERLADVGCGDGFFLKQVHRRFPHKQLVGIDLCDRAIQFARLLCEPENGVGGQIRFECSDVVHDPPAEQFDVVTSVAVLEHIPPDELDEFVAAHHRLLRPGGSLLAVLPSKNLPIRNITRHYQHFDEQAARAMLAPYFEIHAVHHLNNDRLWGGLVGKMLSNRLFILNHRPLRERLFRTYMRRWLRCARPNGYTILIHGRRPSA